jgi:rod shape-determining protein MreC
MLPYCILNKIANNAKKKSNHFGSLIWNGKSTGFVQLIDVPRLAMIEKETPLLLVDNLYFFQKIYIGTY